MTQAFIMYVQNKGKLLHTEHLYTLVDLHVLYNL